MNDRENNSGNKPQQGGKKSDIGNVVKKVKGFSMVIPKPPKTKPKK